MKKHLVTVITPSLNQGQFIEQNILSVAEQTYLSIEHIVIELQKKSRLRMYEENTHDFR